MIETNTTCEFCSIHEPGVYLLSLSGVLVLCLIIIVYWKEVSTLCFGTGKIIQSPALPEIPSQVTIEQQMTAGSGQKLVKSPIPIPSFQVQPQPNKIQSQPAQGKPKSAPQPFPLDFQQPIKDFTRLQTLPQVIEKQSSQTDAFKLPKPNQRRIPASRESTGSNYFKQMMRGKHPVLSISQYDVKKLKKTVKKADKDGAKKHHHHHRKKK